MKAKELPFKGLEKGVDAMAPESATHSSPSSSLVLTAILAYALKKINERYPI